ncbi:response regulator [Magnetococcus sp. PR-3]|uniref:response regulator n=1 Tax=Magnetococcus sp. PR-3 TaxID=3120355 RepID=UPI002FCE0F55
MQSATSAHTGNWRSLLNRCSPTCRLLVALLFFILSALLSGFVLLVSAGEWSPLTQYTMQAVVTVIPGGIGLYIILYRPLLQELSRHGWLLGNLAILNKRMRGLTDNQKLGETALGFLAETVEAKTGSVYLVKEGEQLLLVAGYALPSTSPIGTVIRYGEGMAGEAAKTRHPLRIEQAVPLESGSGQIHLAVHLAIPLLHQGNLQGVMALGLEQIPNERHTLLLTRVSEIMAISFGGAHASVRMQDLLDETQRQKDELSVHQTMLKETIDELEKASKYKSRFLASMSHELRSPLNSLLILSKLLGENRPGNLTEKQVEFAKTIHSAGSDLLGLIDEVLDLARIEAGRIRIFKDKMVLEDLSYALDRLYCHVAQHKKLGFKIRLVDNLPEALHTDRQRVDQILKNLLTNAIKFTETGSVIVTFEPCEPPVQEDKDKPPYTDGDWIRVSVQDTGIGIPEAKQAVVFEPFKQLDDGADRKYPGTGLGLAISQELATLLGGKMELTSVEGDGSTFSLLLPVGELPTEEQVVGSEDEAPPPTRQQDLETIRDDRRTMTFEDTSVLIVGNNHELIREQLESARGEGYAAVVAGDMSSTLFLANLYQPIAVILTTDLPGVDTHKLVDRIRAAIDHETLRILHVAVPGTVLDQQPEGVEIKTLHIASDTNVAKILQESSLFLKSLRDGDEQTQPEVATEINGEQPSSKEQQQEQSTKSTSNKHVGPLTGFEVQAALKKRKILIIEDDMRNIFALTSLLEESEANVLMAKNGKLGLEILGENPDVDIVLLDIMMPDMNGYDVLKHMRADPQFQSLPVIVLTAKALQGERKRCLNAGASDYLPKPVDPPKLLAMLRVWLEKKR